MKKVILGISIIFCVTLTASVLVQPLAVLVTVSVYVLGALALGCATEGFDNPTAGDHE